MGVHSANSESIHVARGFRNLLIWLLLFLLVTTGGCSFKRLIKDLDEQKKMVKIDGKVTAQTTARAPIMVFLLTDDPLQPTLLNYKVLAAPGKFTFTVDPGRYRIFAFEDLDRDQRHQDNEKIGCSGQIDANQSGTQLPEITILITGKTDAYLRRIVDETKSKGKVELVNNKRYVGRIVSLDDPFFANKFVSMGLWQPIKFIKEVPLGVFFMEEFKAEKVPVLFIHGINGSPRFFREIIAGLDREKFQPWLAYYPSGSSIDLVADYLYGILEDLHARYNFKPLEIVAHSMGGLTTLALINRYRESGSHFKIDRIITVSTPFSGHHAAAMGLKYAPAVIPVWRDVVPESEFIKNLFQKPLPDNLPHYLLFSFEGKSRFSKGNSDGVVTIASELRPEAQAGATMVRGFADNHTAILKDSQAILLINQILAHEQ